MALAHKNPGYGHGIIGKYRDVKSSNGCRGYAGAKGLKDMMEIPSDTLDLDDIRRSARDAWLKRDNNETSYQDHYRNRYQDMPEPTQGRPTSSHRKNKPHPPMVFLTNRLHNIPGYQNADTTVGKDAYRVDASVPNFENEQRLRIKEKFAPRPHTGAVNQYKTVEELDIIHDPIERQGTEAWMKLTMDKDKENVLAHLREIRESDAKCRGAVEISNRPKTVPSLHRYLKGAGAGEKHTLDNVYAHARDRGIVEYRPESRANTPIDIVTMRKRDIDRTRSAHHYNHRTKRGDFLMHPEWKPSIYHHRLNGLSRPGDAWQGQSSVDIPYMPGRR